MDQNWGPRTRLREDAGATGEWGPRARHGKNTGAAEEGWGPRHRLAEKLAPWTRTREPSAKHREDARAKDRERRTEWEAGAADGERGSGGR